MPPNHDRVRVGVVLSAGGLRGVAHLGVMRQLLRHNIPMDVIVGSSAGAIVAAYYAAVGLSIDEMIGEAFTFRGRHVVLHGIALRAPRLFRPLLGPFCGIIPTRLRQLENTHFARLKHQVQALGIVCHDLVTDRPLYFATGRRHLASLAEVVKASAAIPGIIPSRTIRRGGRDYRLTDGGISDSLPVKFAKSRGLEATHLIVSDCRRGVAHAPTGDKMIYLRPHLRDVGILHSGRNGLLDSVTQGEAAVTAEILDQVRGWWS